jgi:SpoIID/LytB domain protein
VAVAHAIIPASPAGLWQTGQPTGWVNPQTSTQHWHNANTLRVGISDDAMIAQEYETSVVSANGAFTVTPKGAMAPVWQGEPWQQVMVTRDVKGFYLTPRHGQQANQRLGPYAQPLLFVTTDPKHFLRLPDRTRKGNIPAYRGVLWAEAGYSSPKRLSMVNELPLQDYLRAVVPNELPIRFGAEAVRAQAVAARNYALRPRGQVWPQFDICDSQFCQAYYGQQTETQATDAILQATEGLVALYQGEILLALYSSANGGHSEDYANVFVDGVTKRFPAAPLPYLKGKPDVPNSLQGLGALSDEANAARYWREATRPGFDGLSGLNRWHRQWSNTELLNILKTTLPELAKNPLTTEGGVSTKLPRTSQEVGSQLLAINVTQRGVSGKVMRLNIVTDTGTWQVEREFNVRQAFKSPANGKLAWLPSGNVVFSPLKDANGTVTGWQAHGGGFGHGVGMSQHGASYLHQQGWQFPQILQHYYNGAAIGSIPLLVKPTTVEVTTFKSVGKQGVLTVVGHPQAVTAQEPLVLRLNGQWLHLQQLSPQGHARLDVAPYLVAAPQTNRLEVYPLMRAMSMVPTTPLKAWVEVVLPASP